MYKFFSIFLVSLVLSSSLFCKEANMNILVNVISNEIQEFKRGNYSYRCVPYGILTLERLYINASPDSVCKKSITNFYKKRKNLKFFVEKKMNVQQLYNVIYKDEKCIINIQGEKSLSEVLLDEGLAIKVPSALSREYDFYFYKAQKQARLQRKGLWETNIAKECVASVYVEN